MVEFDPLVVGILVGLIGIALWIVTNWHLVRTGKAIKSDIDAKRAATEEFVKGELASLREDLGGEVQFDAGPLMADFEARIVPAVQERVENVKAAILGKLGYAAKGVKALGEGVATLVGEEAVVQAGFETEWEMRLAQIGMDDEWLKKNKAAAFGLSLLKEGLGIGRPKGKLAGLLPSGRGSPKRGNPPRGFG